MQVDSGNAAGNPVDVQPPPEDRSWAVVAAALDRKAQKEVFDKANYDAAAQQLIVAKVEAERQVLQPDGQWGARELVMGYSPVIFSGEPRIQMIEQDGQKIVRDEDRRYLDSYRALLYTAESQNRILRFEFQSMLEKSPLTWTLPRKLQGFDFELASFGVQFPADDGKGGIKRGAGPWPEPMSPVARVAEGPCRLLPRPAAHQIQR